MYARQGGTGVSIAHFRRLSADGRELLDNPYAAARTPVRILIAEQRAPAETDLQQYFQVSPPSVHEMIQTLERNGLIERTPGQARSIQLLVALEHLPALE